jgi:DedD protein
LSTPFQNRLVGTIIVAAVVIIFLPDLLDGEKKSYQAEFEAIPNAEVFSGQLTSKPFPKSKLVRQQVTPIIKEIAIDEFDPINSDVTGTTSVTIDTTATKDSIASVNINKELPDQPKNLSKSVITERLETKSKPIKLPEKAIAKEAWVIHLGSFKNKKNVEQLLKKLKVNGYVVFTNPIKTKQGMLTKVIIGPELIKSRMVNKLPALKKLTGIQGKVAYFTPN